MDIGCRTAEFEYTLFLPSVPRCRLCTSVLLSLSPSCPSPTILLHARSESKCPALPQPPPKSCVQGVSFAAQDDEAAEILKRLGTPDAVEEVSREIASLGDSRARSCAVQEVFGEFYGLALANNYFRKAGSNTPKRCC